MSVRIYNMKVPIPRNDNHVDVAPKAIPNVILQVRSPARLPPGIDNRRRLMYVLNSTRRW